MLLGAPILSKYDSPEAWVNEVKRRGYAAAYCPVGLDADADTVRAYRRAAQDSGIVIAEVGAWSNMVNPDASARRQALEMCKSGLALAESIGAKCCVNLAGTRQPGGFYEPHPDNLTTETFDLIVEVTREVIDAVRPKDACFVLETMPWIFPDSAENYLRLIKAVDRPAFAAHLDVVNLIYSPHLFFNNTAVIRDCFDKLAPYIKGVHAKDIVLGPELTVHLDEVRPGAGSLDYRTFLTEMDKLPANTPLMLEHLESEEEYTQGAQYLRDLAGEMGIKLL